MIKKSDQLILERTAKESAQSKLTDFELKVQKLERELTVKTSEMLAKKLEKRRKKKNREIVWTDHKFL